MNALRRRTPGRGFTLIELTVVLLILVAVAAIVVPTFSGLGEDSKQAATEASLVRIREAILGDANGSGYVPDLDNQILGEPAARRLFMRDLFVQPAGAPAYDPSTRRGWNGPYLRHLTGRYVVDAGAGFTTDYGAVDDPCVLDGWGNPIVVQRPATAVGTEDERDENLRLVSAGPDGVLTTQPSELRPADLTTQGDDLVLFVFVAGV